MNELITKVSAMKKAMESPLDTKLKNECLKKIAEQLKSEKQKILSANSIDVENGKKAELNPSLIDRLALNDERIEQIAQGVLQVVDLDDPIGEIIDSHTLENGLKVNKIRVPMGIIGMIYEARPNVTVDAAVLCFKTGNGALLRGSSSALNSNRCIVKVMQNALKQCNVNPDLIALFEQEGHSAVDEMIQYKGGIDLIIPRGGAGLIKAVVENSKVPVIETGVGNCHIYIDESANYKMACDIVINAKTQRPGVCNATETVLIHEKWADNIVPFLKELEKKGVTIHGCEKTCEMYSNAKKADENDFKYEYLSLDIAVKIVKNIDEALSHIAKYGTKHTEAIITENQQNADKFMATVDASCINHNASTRFTDGFQFGYGAEIGISTQKLHARGPMGLKEITTYKYLVYGNGQVRK